MHPVIGLSGRKGSGKTTAAQHLVDKHGYTRTSFAAPVKDFAYLAAPKPVQRAIDRFGWDRLKQYGPFRRYLQRVGTEAGRAILGPDVWVNVWYERAAELIASGHRVVVDDIRLDNEAVAVRLLGGIVAAIHTPGRPDVIDSHPTEQKLYGERAISNRYDGQFLVAVDALASGRVER